MTLRRFTLSIVLVSAVALPLKAQQPTPDTLLMQLLPTIPQYITEPDKRAEFLATHFWDKYDFADTTRMRLNNLMERTLVDFFDLLAIVQPDVRDSALIIMLNKSMTQEPKMFRELLFLSEKYLYEPNSPVADEEKLIPVLRFAIQYGKLDEYESARPQFLLKQILTNRIGDKANNFTCTLLNNDTLSLYSIKADYILLFFKNPDCDDCNATAKQLAASETVNDLIANRRLTLLTVYTLDDVETWRKHAPDTPATWLYARDANQTVNAHALYDIKHFPLLYLLDADCKVLLKDTKPEIIENYLKIF